MKKNYRILIVGHKNIVTLALLRRLRQKSFSKLFFLHPNLYDLTDSKIISSFFKTNKPEYCFLMHLKEGGIEANIKYPAELIHENLAIQANVIHSAWKAKVKKLLFLASSCVYPKNCPQPMKEEYLLRGPLEETNEPYAVAKIAGIKMCQAYNKQFGTQFISVIPATVFGQNDDFDIKTSHVIAALIRKFCEAKIRNAPGVTVWGTGKPKREFIYVDDLIDASLFLMKHRNPFEIINIGTGIDISIRDLARTIKKIINFKGKVEFDSGKPDGVLKKLLDIQNLKSLNWKPKVGFYLGLEATCRWYLEKSRKFDEYNNRQ